ncbi:methyltransferase family protein [Haloarcula salinisoli]|uniref:Isoprenylcysteine carboxylmethyltransferase family protein n=1 Tax=Haloarcula salinisoli TaxID=2487746 RepID=A0A8J7YK48_9EURY|nr:isoprenylcysteine carboxylmethyltransferase family protein [Halomicroarcula salinisoli]MBX0287300.1 isoprenylcysteine carboxylmethyltransferase family protein [Halomicroarcula salinisoli]MBX0305133.1 isoprenylcysteine carboxylmethyltransferase family protein [Halomicroarcula salinisoli]
MGVSADYPVAIFVVYTAVAVAFGPDILREIRHRRSGAGTATVRDGRSKQVIGVAGGSGVLTGAVAVDLVPSLTVLGDVRIAVVAGIVVLFVGAGVRQYAVRTLDDYFTSAVQIHQGQQVVDTGPYRWVRHPSYTGGIVMYTGIGLIFNNWVSLTTIVGLLLIAYLYRIRIEERALSEELGEPYREYLERTPYRLVPYLW